MNEMDRAEQRRQATERLTEVLAHSTGTAEHPSGMAIATASATGELKWLRLHPHALGQGPRAVGQLVVETARLATDAAVQRGYNELAKSLGDSMAIAFEGFAGPPPFRTAAAAVAQAGPPAPPLRTAGRPPAHQAEHRIAAHQAEAGPAHQPSAYQPEQRPLYGGAIQPGDDGGARASFDGTIGAFDGTIGAPDGPPDEPPAVPPFEPTPPPPARPGRTPRPPVDDDDDAYFADPFGTGGFRR